MLGCITKRSKKFHARHSAKERVYKYFVINRSSSLVLDKNKAWHIKKNLDVKIMRKGAEILKGTHNFSTFRASSCQAKSPIKTLKKVMINKNIFNFGNPLRKLSLESNKDPFSYFNLNRNKKTILVLGGSLGAKSINEGILNNLSLIRESSFQIIWQTGNYYYDEIISQNLNEDNLVIKPFIQKMNLAYSAADLIISRAGAIAISELCVVCKPLILIPSPNVVDDHQNKNAEEIFNKGGCIIINDLDAKEVMLKESIALLEDKRKMGLMSESLKKLSKPNASNNIVNKVYEIL